MNKRTFFIAAILVLGVVVAVYFYLTSRKLVVSMTAEAAEGDKIRIRWSGGSEQLQVSMVRVWIQNAPEYSWWVDVGYAPVTELIYGTIPSVKNASLMPVTQRYPSNNAAPVPIESGSVFNVAVDFQRDAGFPPVPAGGTRVFRFRKTSDSIEALPIDNDLTFPKHHPQKAFP